MQTSVSPRQKVSGSTVSARDEAKQRKFFYINILGSLVLICFLLLVIIVLLLRIIQLMGKHSCKQKVNPETE